jgi:hypothetical protein
MPRDELFGSIYGRGSLIFQQPHLGDTTMYIIQSGGVEISHKQGGPETVLAMLERAL